MTIITAPARWTLFSVIVLAAACSSKVDKPSPTDSEDDGDDGAGGGTQEIGDCSSVASGGETSCLCIWPETPRYDIRCSLDAGETHANCDCSIDGEIVDVCDVEASAFDCTVSPGVDYGCCEGVFE